MSDYNRYLQQQKDLYGDTLYFETDLVQPLLRSSALPNSSETEASSMPDQYWKKATSIDELDEMIRGCRACPLGDTRKKFVFGIGNPNADVVLIGEAPGAEEDKQGIPFIGRAGKLLTEILKAIDFTRDDVYICNILKCRPPNNRDPLASEVELCEPYLHKQLELLQPKVMLALGRVAAQTLLRTKDSLTKMRETVHEYQGIPLVVTYHPAALLRNPNWKRPAWEDVQKFRALYDELSGKSGSAGSKS